MKKILQILLIVMSSNSFAAGYTGWVVPTQLEYTNGGILVYGGFSDVNSCGQAGYIFIRPTPTDPDLYKTMTSMILTAFTAGKEVRFYTQECVQVSMHWSGNVINAAHYSGLYMR